MLAASLGLATLFGSGVQAQQAAPQDIGRGHTTPTLQQQFAALLQEKVTRTPAQRKIDSQLLYAIKIDRNDPLMQQVPKLRSSVKFTPTNRVEVDIKAPVNALQLQTIRQLGGDIISSVPRYNAIRAELPLNKIETLASSSAVQFIKPAVHPFHNTDSEGDVCHRADLTRNVLGLTGAGVNVGVISGDVLYLSDLESQGLLPGVGVLKGQSGLIGDGSPASNPQADGEGTAMLEIVHDLAPDASLYFATADPSDAQFATNILDLYSQAHCNIIVDDVGFPDESPFQDGIVAQAVDTVTQNGVLYFSCARNTGNLDSTGSGTGSGTWEGDYKDSKLAYNFTWGGFTYTEEMHTFGPSIFNEFANSSVMTLFWADPLGAASDDYDLYAVDSTQSYILNASTNLQDGHQDPYEHLDGALPDGSYLMVGLYNGSGRFLYLEAGINNGPLLQYATAGSTRGHNAAASAFTIGAVDIAQSYPGTFDVSNTIETFSADGPRQIFFNPDGSAITPGNFTHTGGKVLAKPDFAAADGVTCDVPGFAPFHGTSSAAPHAAAIAALMLSYNPALTYSDIGNLFDTTAWKIMNNGNDWNRDAGYGLIDAFSAGVVLVADSLSSTIQVSPTQVTGPASATGTITLSTPAPPNGLPLALSSSSNSAATVPATLTVPAGATTANFNISAKKVSSTTTVTITAVSFPQEGGVTQATGTLTVAAPVTITLTGLSLSSSTVIGGSSVTGTVTLSGNATSSTVVNLSSNNAAAKVPASVTVNAGSKSATFTVTSAAVSTNTSVTISAKLGSVTKSAALTVQAPVLSSLALNPSTVQGGTNVTGTVTLTGPAAATTTVTLSTTNKAATVPASVSVAKGKSSATFTIKTKTPSGSGNSVGTVTAKLGSVSQSQTLTITH
jgi:hypothetical protein